MQMRGESVNLSYPFSLMALQSTPFEVNTCLKILSMH